MSRPVIGICAAVERARFGAWDQDAHLLPAGYAAAVGLAGGLAPLVPAGDASAEHPGELLDRLDGLLLAGGRDIDPLTYGARPDPNTGEPSPERDRFELALASAALERDMPVLGVCRGMQMLNVALGGTLHQHLPDVLGHDDHRHTPGTFGDHEVRLDPGSLAARAAGTERLTVKSHHHQGADRIGDGLTVTGWSAADDVVEAIELPGDAFALGVLWHPEEDVRDRVIGALVEAASGVPAR